MINRHENIEFSTTIDRLKTNKPEYKSITLFKCPEQSLGLYSGIDLSELSLTNINELASAIQQNTTLNDFDINVIDHQYEFSSNITNLIHPLKNHPSLETLYLRFSHYKTNTNKMIKFLQVITDKSPIRILDISIFAITSDFLNGL